MSRTLIVVPTYNEADNLPKLVTALRHHAADADILIVDDASPDGTGDLADSFAASDTGLTIVFLASIIVFRAIGWLIGLNQGLEPWLSAASTFPA